MLNQINFFQFDNLIGNRIPFLLLNLGVDLSGLYSSIQKTHLETYQVQTDLNQAEAELQKKQIPKDFAIVVICQDGRQSAELFKKLEKNGYTNVYVVNGGYQQMMTERP